MERTPPPAATAIQSEAEGSIHPDFCGPKYDELHTSTVKNIDKVANIWLKKRSNHNVEVAKAQGHPLCTDVIANAKKHLDRCDELFKHLEDVKTAAAVKGRGHHFRADLEQCGRECEEIYKLDKDISSAVKALAPLMALNF